MRDLGTTLHKINLDYCHSMDCVMSLSDFMVLETAGSSNINFWKSTLGHKDSDITYRLQALTNGGSVSDLFGPLFFWKYKLLEIEFKI